MIEISTTPFYELRIVVFMETAPQSNTYKQILLDQDQFGKMSQHLGKVITVPDAPPETVQSYSIDFDEDNHYHFDTEIRSIKL